MRLQLLLVSTLFIPFLSICQDVESETDREQQLEAIAETAEYETNEDPDPEELEVFRKHPLNLNHASAEDLKQFSMLTELQVNSLIVYRKLFGMLIDVCELQCISGWSVPIIKRLLPYITVTEHPAPSWQKALREGEQTLVLRYGTALERSAGFTEKAFLGSRDRFSVRYRFNYKNRLRWGIAGDKDAGEPFMKGPQKAGFDFYTFHLFVTKTGKIESLAVGDFTVNMGQGLIQWQSLAFKKSTAVLNIKRQSPVIRPYTGTGEFNFMRGAGITLKRNAATVSLFTSFRKVSGHLDYDTFSDQLSISSFLISGTHRTINEIRDRNNIGRFSSGAVVRLIYPRWQFSVNSIYHRFSLPVLKKDEPYNLFALKGRSFFNNSVDYSFTYKNLHFFGEAGTDKNLAPALVTGLLISLDKKMDAAFLYRRISRRYQSVIGNAFSENSLPNNEEGLYMATSIKPDASLCIEGYMDLFHFPWLKYRVNASSGGKDFLVSVTFKPNKKVDLYSRFKSDFKYLNRSGSGLPVDPIELQQRQSFRVHANIKLSKEISFQNRFEFTSFKAGKAEKEEGAMIFFDLQYKPAFSRWSAHGRIQYFSIDSYETRIYAYESRLPGLFSIPSIYGNGKRYLVNLNHRLTSGSHTGWKTQISVGWTQTVYQDAAVIGTGLDEVKGRHRSEVSVQLLVNKE